MPAAQVTTTQLLLLPAVVLPLLITTVFILFRAITTRPRTAIENVLHSQEAVCGLL